MDKVHYGQLYANTRVGTAIYMAPEVLNNVGRYGKPADIWSLGAVISFICNGAHLFLDANKVVTWKGGKSTLDGTMYGVDLCQLTASMLCPLPAGRPTASQIFAETKKMNRTCEDKCLDFYGVYRNQSEIEIDRN